MELSCDGRYPAMTLSSDARTSYLHRTRRGMRYAGLCVSMA